VLSDVFVGRIHSAVVTGVNLETNSVTVEWLEKNEIKGKEARISFIMVTLCNRADHYIFAVVSFFFLSFFFSPSLSGRRLDVCHTSTHCMALVQI